MIYINVVIITPAFDGLDGRVSYSVFPTWDYFEQTLNYIPFVNIFSLFITTLSFKYENLKLPIFPKYIVVQPHNIYINVQ